MHFDVFDRYQFAESWLHRRDPRVKVLWTGAFVLTAALLPDGAWYSFGLLALWLLAANLISGLGWAFSLKRSFLALPFLLAAVSAIFAPLGQPLAAWQIGPWVLQPTSGGVVRFASIALRSWLSVQAAILLVAVTPFPDILHAFEHLRLPRILSNIIAFLYRYLFVLVDEVFRLLQARSARSAALPGQPSGRTVWWRASVTGNMAGQMFVRAYERADRIYNAMISRGYQGQLLTIAPHAMTRSDWQALVLGLAGLLLTLLAGWIR
jgi:cobalt/nickel transport system permease protein